ncbi:hypothetical protein E6C60_3552 [Paenibacillus algicola]|uniref:Uncharacterized protein n=1 Tax=Paenibacillus algicola TaxID=2565926 RepID=A0A4P8XN53_9BACL|nr:hypothetical protein E6C60_3552 [Paenibacillus algicola]
MLSTGQVFHSIVSLDTKNNQIYGSFYLQAGYYDIVVN